MFTEGWGRITPAHSLACADFLDRGLKKLRLKKYHQQTLIFLALTYPILRRFENSDLFFIEWAHQIWRVAY